jgi:hypothetical protein
MPIILLMNEFVILITCSEIEHTVLDNSWGKCHVTSSLGRVVFIIVINQIIHECIILSCKFKISNIQLSMMGSPHLEGYLEQIDITIGCKYSLAQNHR